MGAPAVVVAQKKNRQKIIAAATVLGWLLAATAVVMAAMYAKRLTSAQRCVQAQIERPRALISQMLLTALRSFLRRATDRVRRGEGREGHDLCATAQYRKGGAAGRY